MRIKPAIMTVTLVMAAAIIVTRFLRLPDTGQDGADRSPVLTVDRTSTVNGKHQAPRLAPVLSAGPDQAAGTQAERQPRAIDTDPVNGFDDTLASLDLPDVETLADRMGKWLRQRGFAGTDLQGNLLLDQPYQQLDNETLQLYAENGDMWAQQLLAGRIRETRPADAAGWYTRAAQNGSIYAMQQLQQLYRQVDHASRQPPRSDTHYRQQLNDLQHAGGNPDQVSTAWSVVAQLTGAAPENNAPLAARLEDAYSAAERDNICTLARDIYSNLLAGRAGAGLGTFDRHPPPFSPGGMQGLGTVPCAEQLASMAAGVGPDFSGCKEVEMMSDNGRQRMTVCGPTGQDPDTR